MKIKTLLKKVSLVILFAWALPPAIYAGLGEPVKQIETIRDGSGTLYLFTLGSDGGVYFARQAGPNASWLPGKAMRMHEDTKGDYPDGGPKLVFIQIATTISAGGNINVFGLQNTGRVFFAIRSTSNIDNWSDWINVGNFNGSAVSTDFAQIITIKSSNQQVFGLKRNAGSVSVNFMRTEQQNIGSKQVDITSWNGWTDLYGTGLNQLVGEEDVPSNQSVLLALSNDGSVYQIRGRLNSWQNWSSLYGSEIRKIAIGKNNIYGHLITFAIGGDRAIYERHEINNEGGWSEWAFMGGTDFKDLTSGVNAVGRVTFFGLHQNGSVDCTWQNDAGWDVWSSWKTLGGPGMASIQCSNNQDGRLELFGRGSDGSVYHIWQTSGSSLDGSWNTWVRLY